MVVYELSVNRFRKRALKREGSSIDIFVLFLIIVAPKNCNSHVGPNSLFSKLSFLDARV